MGHNPFNRLAPSPESPSLIAQQQRLKKEKAIWTVLYLQKHILATLTPTISIEGLISMLPVPPSGALPLAACMWTTVFPLLFLGHSYEPCHVQHISVLQDLAQFWNPPRPLSFHQQLKKKKNGHCILFLHLRFLQASHLFLPFSFHVANQIAHSIGWELRGTKFTPSLPSCCLRQTTQLSSTSFSLFVRRGRAFLPNRGTVRTCFPASVGHSHTQTPLGTWAAASAAGQAL